jgi:hypothetical protein
MYLSPSCWPPPHSKFEHSPAMRSQMKSLPPDDIENIAAPAAVADQRFDK